ncbi:MAG TPA: T9SS type A sorting domain-containing protein [bacterium]|jgi:curli biogenesis system outer membrane secretion channel CsgG
MSKKLTFAVLLLLPSLLLAGNHEPIATTSGNAAKSHERAAEKPSLALPGPTANSESYSMKMNTGVITVLEMSAKGSHSLIGAINLPVVMVTPMAPMDAKPAKPVITEYALHQNYPNPFNPVTEIRFDLPKAEHVRLKVYNALGQEVANLVDEARDAGTYNVTWNASSVAAGMYICQIRAGNFVSSQKMLLLK